MIKAIYRNNKIIVRINNEESNEFRTNIGAKQGCVLTPLLFSLVVDEVLIDIKKRMEIFKLGNWK